MMRQVPRMILWFLAHAGEEMVLLFSEVGNVGKRLFGGKILSSVLNKLSLCDFETIGGINYLRVFYYRRLLLSFPHFSLSTKSSKFCIM